MKLLSTTFILLFAIGANAQNILLVDNTPSAPGGAHVYSTIQEAIDAASPGDIIHVKPSATSYGNITIAAATDSITIYGIGLKPDKEILLNSTVGTVYITGSNVKISGLIVSGYTYIGYNGTAANISFENNSFDSYIYAGYNSTTSNVLFRNCLINYLFYTNATYSNNIVINNCIFSGYNANGQVNLYPGTLVSHCLFFGSGSYSAFGNLQSSTISNSIFFGKSPQASSTSNSTFNNCLAIENTNNTFPTANGNSVNGTIATITGGVFADATIAAAAAWNVNWDPALDTTSVELINTGDDGTDIGLTGGTIPFNKNASPLPYIKSFIVPSVIKQGDDLNVTINALGN